MIEERVDTKTYTRIAKEEHLLSLSFGTAKRISNTIFEYFEGEISRDTSQLLTIGCDGTTVNTGWKNGIQLQCVICLLHFNELPQRHLFDTLDGLTKGLLNGLFELSVPSESLQKRDITIVEADKKIRRTIRFLESMSTKKGTQMFNAEVAIQSLTFGTINLTNNRKVPSLNQGQLWTCRHQLSLLNITKRY